MKPNTESSSAPSPLLQLIIFWPPVPVLMMRHRFGQGEAAAAFQQRMHKHPAAPRPPGQVPGAPARRAREQGRTRDYALSLMPAGMRLTEGLPRWMLRLLR